MTPFDPRFWQTTEGGRVEKELDYIKNHLDDDGVLTTDEIIIQTHTDPDGNLLTPSALLLHLEVLKAATQVTVDLFDS